MTGPGARAWLVVAAGFMALAVSFTGRALLGLTMTSWEETFEWSRSFVSACGAIALVVTGVLSPVAGNVVDRFGPRPVLVAGLVGLAGAGGLAAVADRPWHLVLALGLLGGVGYACVAQHVIAAALAARFETWRGLATGLALSGSTAGQLLLVPLMAWLLTDAWRTAPFELNAVLALVLVALTWPTLARRSGGAAGRIDPREGTLARLRGLFRHPTFVALFAGFTLCGFTTTGVVEAHLFPYAALCGYVPLESAQAYSVLAGGNLVGMIATGWLADRIHRPLLLATIYLLRAVSFVVLMEIAGDIRLLFLFAAMFGVLNFSVFPVIASLVASHLGVGVMGLALGLLFAGHSVGAATGMVLAGVLYDLFARYLWTWLIALALAALAGFVTLAIRDRAAPALAPA
jgi:MFS family permease